MIEAGTTVKVTCATFISQQLHENKKKKKSYNYHSINNQIY